MVGGGTERQDKRGRGMNDRAGLFPARLYFERKEKDVGKIQVSVLFSAKGTYGSAVENNTFCLLKSLKERVRVQRKAGESPCNWPLIHLSILPGFQSNDGSLVIETVIALHRHIRQEQFHLRIGIPSLFGGGLEHVSISLSAFLCSCLSASAFSFARSTLAVRAK